MKEIKSRKRRKDAINFHWAISVDCGKFCQFTLTSENRFCLAKRLIIKGEQWMDSVVVSLRLCILLSTQLTIDKHFSAPSTIACLLINRDEKRKHRTFIFVCFVPFIGTLNKKKDRCGYLQHIDWNGKVFDFKDTSRVCVCASESKQNENFNAFNKLQVECMLLCLLPLHLLCALTMAELQQQQRSENEDHFV